jgi:D-glycero-D-manno-heptose 1,7-bisphosphate phosphatase
MTTTSTRPAVFFDRDGVLNHDAGYLFEAAKFKWMDGAREAVRLVRSSTVRIIPRPSSSAIVATTT